MKKKRFFYSLFFWTVFFSVLPANTFATEYVFPYPGFMPGNKLYKMSEVIDRIQEYWSFGSFSQFIYHLGMADKKMIETKTLFEYKQYLLGSVALDRYNYHLERAALALEKASEEGKDITLKKNQLRDAISAHQKILKDLMIDLPESFEWNPEKGNRQSLKLDQMFLQSKELGTRIIAEL